MSQCVPISQQGLQANLQSAVCRGPNSPLGSVNHRKEPIRRSQIVCIVSDPKPLRYAGLKLKSKAILTTTCLEMQRKPNLK